MLVCNTCSNSATSQTMAPVRELAPVSTASTPISQHSGAAAEHRLLSTVMHSRLQAEGPGFMHEVERLKTGIAALDEVLHGGLIPERVYLVEAIPVPVRPPVPCNFCWKERATARSVCM